PLFSSYNAVKSGHVDISTFQSILVRFCTKSSCLQISPSPNSSPNSCSSTSSSYSSMVSSRGSTCLPSQFASLSTYKTSTVCTFMGLLDSMSANSFLLPAICLISYSNSDKRMAHLRALAVSSAVFNQVNALQSVSKINGLPCKYTLNA